MSRYADDTTNHKVNLIRKLVIKELGKISFLSFSVATTV